MKKAETEILDLAAWPASDFPRALEPFGTRAYFDIVNGTTTYFKTSYTSLKNTFPRRFATALNTAVKKAEAEILDLGAKKEAAEARASRLQVVSPPSVMSPSPVPPVMTPPRTTSR